MIRVLTDHFGTTPPKRIGVAVSGGSDSLAALYAMHAFALEHLVELSAVTVDHGLRAGSSDEAKKVASICQDLGVSHTILEWQGWNGDGNLQKAAREARYRLMSEWARSRAIDQIVLGHTQDDQAETVLMRLARGAGVDGLSAMKPSRKAQGITWARPLLGLRREELRDYLVALGVVWVEDPSNHDAQFDRVKVREALALLEPLGITVPHLAQVANNMSRARTVLERQAYDTAREILRCEAGAVAIDRDTFWTLPDDTRRRLMNGILSWISGSDYAPRGTSLAETLVKLRDGRAGTLDGCHMMLQGSDIWVFREFQAVHATISACSAVWDNRWRLIDTHHIPQDAQIRALGDNGLIQCADWRNTGIPHSVLRSTPSVWQGEQLIAAPFGQSGSKHIFALVNDTEDLFAALLSH